MKKTNFLWSLLALMAVAVFGFGVAACGGSSSEGGGGGGNDSNTITGTWSFTEGRESLTLTFAANGKGTWVHEYNAPYSGSEIDHGTFTYQAESATRGIAFIEGLDDSYGSGSSTTMMYYEISKGKLLITSGGWGEEPEWVLSKSGTGSDDDDAGTPVASLIGTWKETADRETLTLTFAANGKGTWALEYRDPYSGTETERGAFTYKAESATRGILIVEGYDSSYGSGSSTKVMYYEISGNRMYVYEEGYGVDLDWELTKQ